MKKTLLIGGGGHARSVVQTMGKERFVGYVALRPSKLHPGVPYEGDDHFVTQLFSPDEYNVHIAVGFINGCSLLLRRSIINDYKGYEAVTLISDKAVVAEESHIADGTAVMARAVVNGARIGRHCVINTGSIVEHDCELGDNVFIGPGAILCGEVTVASDVFIGAGAVIRNGITIAPGVNVGMGAVVTHDLTEPGVYIGNPARKLQTRPDEKS